MDRMRLRLSSAIMFAGILLSMVSGLLHPDSVPANEHPAVFAEYAASFAWIGVHLGQFIGMTILTAGLLVLSAGVEAIEGLTFVFNRLGSTFFAVALSLYGVLQAVDGVALKHAVDALALASETERAARFASAETVRWLEWGFRSYHAFAFGLALMLFAATLIRSQAVSKPIAALMGATGLSYWVQGWIIGNIGFAPANSLPSLVGIATILAWSIWLLIDAWRSGRPLSSGK